MVCSRKSTPRPMRTTAPIGTLPLSNFSPMLKLCPRPRGSGAGWPSCSARAVRTASMILVDPEKRDTNDADYIQRTPLLSAHDQRDEDQQVRQSFGVLRAVDGAHAEGKESGKDACDSGIRAGTEARRRRTRSSELAGIRGLRGGTNAAAGAVPSKRAARQGSQ